MLILHIHQSQKNSFVASKGDLEENWTISTVDSSTASYYFYPCLDLDSNNNPHIGYYDIVNYSLKYAHRSESQEDWEITTVIANEPVGYSYSLALSSDDRPYLMYQQLE